MRRVLNKCVCAVLMFGATLVISSRPAAASTLTVCHSGCAYSDLQAAIDAARPGDTILLNGGETYTGHFELPAKDNPSGTPIVIRTSTVGAALPGPGVRLVPDGYPGANVDRSALARIVGRGGQWKTTMVIRALPNARHYRLELLHIDGTAQEGFGTLVEIGTNGPTQTTYAEAPADIVLDRVFIHGHPTKGQRRCLSLNGSDVAIVNSHVSACMNLAMDAQAVATFNGPGPTRILNNYLEGSSENVLIGGADPSIPGLVPSDIEIRRNHITKPLAWRYPLLEAPANAPSADPSAGGGLPGGQYFFKIVGVIEPSGDPGFSSPSPERSVWVPDGGKVTLSWSGVSGADRYRVYVGTSSDGQDRFIETSGSETAAVYSGEGEWGTPPSEPTRWSVKNLLELKNAQRVTIEGNVFEHLWPGAQTGYALLLTPRNEEGTAPWSVVQDVTIANNVIRHASGGFNILGWDDIQPSGQTARIAIRNNLIYDISAHWGGSSHFAVITRSPADLTFDHNTIFAESVIILADDGASYGFRFTNNLAPHNEYGIFGSGAGTGTQGLSVYFPDAVFRRNALGGGPESRYPADNFFPDITTFRNQFVSPDAGDFRLVPGSLFASMATDGRDLGVDFPALTAAVAGVLSSGDTLPGAGSPPPSGGGGGDDGDGTGSSPMTGTAAALPGLLQAENFDAGANGVAYRDGTPGNDGGQYRNTDVDVESSSDAGGGYNVGWIGAGEWLKYTVDVASSGTFDLEFRIASSGRGGEFHLEVDGRDVTGPVAIPDTGGWQSWTSMLRTGVSLQAGRQVWTIVFDGDTNGIVGNLNYVRVTPVTTGGGTAPTSPYSGSAVALPGTLEAENFDQGSAGQAFSDSTSGNNGGTYRSTDVDIEGTADVGGGYNIGWMTAGEWLRYTVNVTAAGACTLEFRVASAGQGGRFHLEVNGADVTGPIWIPDTGGWQSWTSVSKPGVVLPAGPQIWTLVVDDETAGIVGNINYIRVLSSTGGTTLSTPYGGTASRLPGLVDAENFDEGGAGIAYFDTSGGNSGGAYRSTGVDIEPTDDGGYSVGWASAGEWLQYTVHVDAAGAYDVEFRVASAGQGGTFHLEVNGADVTGPLAVPSTGGWQSWLIVRANGVALAAGPQVWRLVLDANGDTGAVGNFDFIRIR